MSEHTWRWLREAFYGSDLARAARVEEAALSRVAEGTLDPALRAEQERLARTPDRALLLGRVLEGPRAGSEHRVSAEALAHHHIVGGTEVGKSTYLLSMISQLLTGRRVDSVLVLDMKGELAELLTEQVLPGLAASLPPREADALLDRVVIVNPFSATHLPPLNVLMPDPALAPEVQVRDVSECFEAATESTVSLRMDGLLGWSCRLVMDALRGRGSLLAVRRALQEPLVLDGLVRACGDVEIKRYFLTRFAAEPKASKLALLARLDRFLALPVTRLCLGANTCLDFDALLADKIVVINLGGAPAGLQSVARFFAMLVLTRVVRAVFRRPVQARGFASVIIGDEWQLALTPSLAAEFENVLTLARSRGVRLWLAHQALSQLDGFGGSLRSTVLGQMAMKSVFRVAQEDARQLRQVFPSTGTLRRHANMHSGNAFLSANEELDARTSGASRMPNRRFYFADARKPGWEVALETPTFVLPDPQTLPPAYVARATTGVVAVDAATLRQQLVAGDEQLDQLAAAPNAAAGSRGSSANAAAAGVTASTTPAPVTPAPRRRRGGGGLPRIG